MYFKFFFKLLFIYFSCSIDFVICVLSFLYLLFNNAIKNFLFVSLGTFRHIMAIVEDLETGCKTNGEYQEVRQQEHVEDKKTVVSQSNLINKRKRVIKQVFLLTFWILLFEGIGAIIGRVIKVGTGAWYDGLNQSPLVPPDIVFVIVWPTLYLSLAIFGWILCNQLKEPKVKCLFTIFWIQNLLNWLWAPVFQIWHETVLSLVILVILVVINAFMIIRLVYLRILIMGLKSQYVSLIILPYLLWLCWATHLNAFIVALN